MGRPSKLTPKTQERIIGAIRVGATYALAAQYGGISYDTFNNWMIKGGNASRGKYFDFFNAVKSAEGDAAVKWLALIDKAAAETWQAAAWKLERRYPGDYGRTVQSVEHSGSVDVRNLTDEELRAIVASGGGGRA